MTLSPCSSYAMRAYVRPSPSKDKHKTSRFKYKFLITTTHSQSKTKAFPNKKYYCKYTKLSNGWTHKSVTVASKFRTPITLNINHKTFTWTPSNHRHIYNTYIIISNRFFIYFLCIHISHLFVSNKMWTTNTTMYILFRCWYSLVWYCCNK